MDEALWGGVRFCACCARLYEPAELRDDESRRVARVCGICQACQDEVYGPGEGPVVTVHRSGLPVLLTKTLQ